MHQAAFRGAMLEVDEEVARNLQERLDQEDDPTTAPAIAVASHQQPFADQTTDRATLEVQERMHLERLARVRAQLARLPSSQQASSPESVGQDPNRTIRAQTVRYAPSVPSDNGNSRISYGSGPTFPSAQSTLNPLHGMQPLSGHDRVNVSGMFSDADRYRPLRSAPVGAQRIQHVTQQAGKMPTFTPGTDVAVQFLDDFEAWAVRSGHELDTARIEHLPAALNGTARMWNTVCTHSYPSWMDWSRAFTEMFQLSAQAQILSHQALNVLQADNEPLTQFALRKLQQFRHYCPQLSEVERIQTIIRLAHQRSRPYLTMRDYRTEAEFLAYIPYAVRNSETAEVYEVPRNHSDDPHVVQDVEFSRPTKSLLHNPIKKTATGKPAKLTETRKGQLPVQFVPAKAPLKAAHDRVNRPPRKEPFKPRPQAKATPSGSIRCYRCGQDGHISRDCKQPKDKEFQRKNVALVQSFADEYGVDLDAFAVSGLEPLDDQSDSSGGEEDYESDDSNNVAGAYVASDVYSGN